MSERDPGPRTPESLLQEAKQTFRHTMLKDSVVREIFNDLLTINNEMSLEPYTRHDTCGMYAEVTQTLKLPSGKDIYKTYGSYLPLLSRDNNGNFTEITASFLAGMIKMRYDNAIINRVVLLFESAAAKLQQAVPSVLLQSDPKTFTWRIVRE